ncbi:hypothetical protein [Croceimicrobium sp.]|uniref:hypothetical protein n=1 Tax=Croceimicrobium sp. TaxID=2828340 RepID=UPI003BA994A5
MENDWKPNAPDANRAFNQQAHNENLKEERKEHNEEFQRQAQNQQEENKRTETEEKEKEKREMVTRAMQKQLERQRETPQPQMAPQPPGGIQSSENRQKNMNEREKRIQYIKERMGAAQERLRGGFGKSKR